MTNLASFVEALPQERVAPVLALLDVLRRHLPEGFKEHSDGRMVHFTVPHSIYPAGYHCNPKDPLPFVSVASTKSQISLYHMGLYADPDLLSAFQMEWNPKECGRLDMGKSCIRFKRPERLTAALPVLSSLFERMSPEDWISVYEAAFKG